MAWPRPHVVPALLLCYALCAAAYAAEPVPATQNKTAQPPSAWKRVKAAHDALEKHGIGLAGWVQLDGSTVAAGGQPNPLGFDGQYLIDLTATLDTGKLIHLPGGTVMLDAQSHSGPSILTHQFPALQDPDNIDAYAETSLDRAWYQQNLWKQRVQMQVGLMYVDDQFFTVPYGGNFVSLDFSSDASTSTFVLPTFPKGSFGGDVQVVATKSLSFSGGAYNDHSTELPYDPGGVLSLTEEAWQSHWHGRPYKLQVGAWRDTGRFERFAGGVQHHAAGAYLVASDKLWQPRGAEDRGLGMFVQFGTGPPAVANVRSHIGAGLVWTGPSAKRPHDEMGLAFSDSLLTHESSFPHGYENEVEAYYQIHVGHGLTIQPDMEFWQHPSGGRAPNTILALTRIMYTF